MTTTTTITTTTKTTTTTTTTSISETIDLPVTSTTVQDVATSTQIDARVVTEGTDAAPEDNQPIDDPFLPTGFLILLPSVD